jgi:hypothetical protein
MNPQEFWIMVLIQLILSHRKIQNHQPPYGIFQEDGSLEISLPDNYPELEVS